MRLCPDFDLMIVAVIRAKFNSVVVEEIYLRLG